MEVSTEGPTMRCPMCRQLFKPRRSDQCFCSDVCNRAFENLALKRCRVLYRALYHWRNSRKDNTGDDLRFICREIASWKEEDELAQRLPPPRHNHEADRGKNRRITVERHALAGTAP